MRRARRVAAKGSEGKKTVGVGGREAEEERRWRPGGGAGFQLDGANSDPEFILSISARWSGKELGSSARRSLY